MRNTYRARNRSIYPSTPASNEADGASIPAPVGGWDAFNPIAQMPPKNAIALVNWFPQPGYIELRRGHLISCDTLTGSPVESLMGYMSSDSSQDILIAASGGSLFDVTTSVPATLGTGYASNRWQFTDFAGTGGSFLFMVDGIDPPQYWDGSALVVPTITRSDSGSPNDFINIAVYNGRLWFVCKNSTKAFYLDLDSVAGTAHEFDVGNQFLNGGYLQAIGTWSTSTTDGPNEFIAFISSQGDIAIYIITDPTTTDGVFYRGRSEISQPVGNRCVTKVGSDLGVITLDGILPISEILTYDKAALIGASITKNIRGAITQAVRVGKDFFGWQLHSYPRNTMAILNVPVSEGEQQDQFVMNTLTGAWARFTGQNANVWEVFHDLAYFGGNDGVVRLADAAGGDQNQTLVGDMQQAFNYFGARGQIKDFTMLRPNITINPNYPVEPSIGLNIDFGAGAQLDPIDFGNGQQVSLWNSAIWNQSIWEGDITDTAWGSASGLGYCASIHMNVMLPWTESAVSPLTLQVNGFDIIYQKGGFI